MLRLNRFIPALIGSVVLLSGTLVAFAQDGSYTVVTGDSLDKIGAIYDVQAACLAKTNNIGVGDILKPGQILTISFDCPLYDGVDNVTTPREVNKNVTENLGQGGGGGATSTPYQVQRGDSLDSIGQTLNVSVDALIKANGLEGNTVLQPGQEITIPAGAPAYGLAAASVDESGQGGGGGTPSVTTSAEDLSKGDATYVVQYQDTLDSIGAQYDVKVDCLVSDNKIEDRTKIYPGQVLTVKTSCPRYDGFDIVLHPRAS
ncbi:MAG: LysM peptidoglycan-binding domain-containing protein [Anaerolineaceae bacterium]|nr:LysM peptidoglycan-binding domain-containing protein [Anaerolineaceae bacterium]